MIQGEIGIIGGGASGMTAAIAAAWAGADVTLIEGGDRVGRKILSTGNGKCNLGNLQLSEREYYGAEQEWIKACLSRFDTEETLRFFGKLGLLVKEKNGGLYPVCEQASAVLDVLRAELRACGVKVLTRCRVEEVHMEPDGRFQVRSGDRVFLFQSVILACGGKAAPKTGSDGSGYELARQLGHAVVPVVPALVQLRCREKYLKEVAGVRAEAAVRILTKEKEQAQSAGAGLPPERTSAEEFTEQGELQLTDYGISGIPVFQLSRQVNVWLQNQGDGAEAEVSVDLLPGCSGAEFAALRTGRRMLLADRTVEEFFTGILNKKLMLLFIKMAGLKRETPVEEADPAKIDRVYALCRDWRLHVTGSNSFDSAQVCAGGVDTAQVGTDLQSLRTPGLYFAGEILDVDGRCGGYNLHWAWCSGYLAGSGAANARK
ncbi:MAG: aminoacetone oxidase family FAD-binding enzyme [Muribaculum sp.]|nr:aminoacetone oxidase family FAD-binding enzyme [Muribaculum sp.]